MKTEYKIYFALALLAALGASLWFSSKSRAKALDEHTAAAVSSADKPTISSKEEADKITKLEIDAPGKDKDDTKKTSVVLEKKGDAWEVVKPVAAKANAQNVKSLLDNLKDLKVKETIDKGTATYKQYELTDEKAVHVAAYAGSGKSLELWFGKSGSRGQLARIGGKDGVFVVGGYSSFLYTREVKNWRETSILKFEDANVIQAEIENKNGSFSFSKNGDKWSGTFAKRDKDGKAEKDKDKDWKKFDEAKVKDMLRAYKSLNAEDFADEKADTGIDKAAEEGGIIKIKLKDNGGDYTIKVGKSKGSSRYATKEPGDGTVYVISSWAADWATAAQSKFEKSDDKKKGGKDAAPEPPPMPPMPDDE
jgi:hypothetical protein